MELTLENLRKDFGPHRAVAGVSAVLRPGVYGLLGANGAGKTTLLRMLCGVLRPTAGQIRLDGAPITSLGADYRARLGYLPQEFGGYPNYTARAFLLYMAALKGLRRDEALPQIDKLLRLVGLQEAGRARLGSYSGGMRRRLGIAQALLGEPDILVLDEPTAGLDPKERVHFRNLLAEYAAGRIVLLSTHIVGDLEAAADTVFLMKDGRFLAEGSVPDLLHSTEGRVWELAVPAADVPRWQARATVAALRHTPGGVTLRLLANTRPDEAARPAAPTLEDFYLQYFPEPEGGAAP